MMNFITVNNTSTKEAAQHERSKRPPVCRAVCQVLCCFVSFRVYEVHMAPQPHGVFVLALAGARSLLIAPALWWSVVCR